MKTTFNSLAALLLVLSACGDDDGAPTDAGPDVVMVDGGVDAGDAAVCEATGNDATYVFESRFEAGASSVAYSGQTFRHLLIAQMKSFMDGLSDQVDAGRFMTAGSVRSALDFFFLFDGDANGEELVGFSTDPEALQATWNDVSSGKNLVGKTAGYDDVTDHRDWDGGDFRGWNDTSINGGEAIGSPQALIEAFFDALGQNAQLRAEGSQPTGPNGEALPVYVTADGLDLSQLIQKTLLMAVTFSQAADDYLDDDVDGKGLLAPNTRDGDAAYSSLEHQWDEGFGYFGAPRDYDLYTDDELSSAGGREDWQGHHDTDGDCRIDLRSEVAFGASVNAAKRDRGATEATDFTADAFDAFVAGRGVIASAGDTLTPAELDMLRGYRDTAIGAWEQAIAATVVHYINDTIADMDAIGTDTYSFEDHAKHWAELKGFAIGFQFSPRSPLNEEVEGSTLFEELHALVGDRPVFADGDVTVADYRADLLAARDLLRDAYGFSAANVEGW